MSGGHFGYQQYAIHQIAEDIRNVIDNNNDETLDAYGQARGHHLPPEIIGKFHEAVKVLRIAYIYAHRIDYLLSGDDGEESFLRRLEEELEAAR